MLSELRYRDALLFWTGIAMLLALVIVTLLSISDPRLILGINPWIKPMKFLTSITLFLWSFAWFMPETADKPRQRQIVRWVRELFGFPDTASGVFVTGSSMANAMALLVARTKALGPQVRDRGLDGALLTAHASNAAQEWCRRNDTSSR